ASALGAGARSSGPATRQGRPGSDRGDRESGSVLRPRHRGGAGDGRSLAMNEAMRVLWLRMMADRRKFGLMCMLMAIGLLLWGRLIILQRVPRSSYARPEAPVAPAAIEGSTASGATSEPPIVKVKTATNLSRDPFVPPASYEQ